jgi:ABC-type branched-subunit amino acid transport system ATPase component
VAERASFPALQVDDLHVCYGQSHALQGVSLRLVGGILAVVGRNGMGKTTLCNALTGLVPTASGTIRVAGKPVGGLPPHRIARLGVGYVPQGRRIWRSLTVDEHLKLVACGGRDAVWTVDRIYQTFPRLAERRHNGGYQLSGGEQQMLAIARALLGNPSLLVMDEPSEGLAPVIVEQVGVLLRGLVAGGVSVLLIEQNLGVVAGVAERVAVMVSGRIACEMDCAELAKDEALQQRLLGVGRHIGAF